MLHLHQVVELYWLTQFVTTMALFRVVESQSIVSLEIILCVFILAMTLKSRTIKKKNGINDLNSGSRTVEMFNLGEIEMISHDKAIHRFEITHYSTKNEDRGVSVFMQARNITLKKNRRTKK